MLLNATLAHMPHGICMFGADKKLALANDLYSTMYGLKPEQIPPGTPLLDILNARIEAGSSPKDADKYIEERLADAHSPRPSYVINELQDGRILAISRQAMPDGGSVAIHQDITTQKRAEEKIAYLAHYDALTNLANRARFLEHVSAAAEKYRQEGKRFAVHLLDLDRFKEVNDSLGHAIGDALLFEIASRLSDSVGPGNVVARLGGDEFTVLQAIGESGSDDAILLANKIRQIISRPFDIDGHHLTIETSIGIALAPEHGLVAHELLKKADLALYRTKADGRNGWRLFESDMEQAANERLTMAMALRESIEREEFELRYQPVVSVTNENVVGVEALLRWRNPQGELVGPGSFIPLAEDTGLIIPLGEWVLRRACRDAAGWPSHVRLAVNLSPVQIRGGDMVETVKRALKDSGLPANRLELEVTEIGAVAAQRAEPHGAARAAEARHRHRARRLRHRLFVAELSAELPVRQDQDRPHLRGRTVAAQRLRGDRQRGLGPGAKPQHHDHRGRRRDRRAVHAAARGRLHAGAGLSVRPAVRECGARVRAPAGASQAVRRPERAVFRQAAMAA